MNQFIYFAIVISISWTRFKIIVLIYSLDYFNKKGYQTCNNNEMYPIFSSTKSLIK